MPSNRREIGPPQLTDDFRFSSPVEVDIDRPTYFERGIDVYFGWNL